MWPLRGLLSILAIYICRASTVPNTTDLFSRMLFQDAFWRLVPGTKRAAEASGSPGAIQVLRRLGVLASFGF